MTGAIRIEDLTLGYDGHPAVHHLDGTFEAGSLTAIVGPNGSGKSTLLKGIMGTLTPIGGKISRSGDVFESDGFLRLFDLPSPAATSEKRVTTTVPQQYLFMMNSAFMKARSEAFGNWMRELPGELPQKLHAAYQRLYSRAPEPSEIDLGSQWLGTNSEPERWHRYAQVLLSAHELIQIQ